MKIILVLLLIINATSGCSKAENGSFYSENYDDKILSGSSDIPEPPRADQVKFVEPDVAKSKEIISQKVIKNANLLFETNDLQGTYSHTLATLKKYQAIVQNDSEGKNDESIYKRMYIRVPSKNFDGLINALSASVTHFDNKQISSQDVTEEYIDIDARLKAKRTLENRYLDLLKKATKVSEILEIEKQLSTIREEIESKQGQRRYLESQISMSIVELEFYKNIAHQAGATISYGSKIWNAVESGFNSISNFFLGLIARWPFLVILAAVLYFIRKRIKQKKDK